jgi:hypothetical protein
VRSFFIILRTIAQSSKVLVHEGIGDLDAAKDWDSLLDRNKSKSLEEWLGGATHMGGEFGQIQAIGLTMNSLFWR